MKSRLFETGGVQTVVKCDLKRPMTTFETVLRFALSVERDDRFQDSQHNDIGIDPGIGRRPDRRIESIDRVDFRIRLVQNKDFSRHDLKFGFGRTFQIEQPLSRTGTAS